MMREMNTLYNQILNLSTFGNDGSTVFIPQIQRDGSILERPMYEVLPMSFTCLFERLENPLRFLYPNLMGWNLTPEEWF